MRSDVLTDTDGKHHQASDLRHAWSLVASLARFVVSGISRQRIDVMALGVGYCSLRGDCREFWISFESLRGTFWKQDGKGRRTLQSLVDKIMCSMMDGC